MTRLIPFLALGLTALGLTGQSPAARETDVLIPGVDGRRFAGTLTTPSNARPPFAVALSFTGSGLHLRDGNRTPNHPYRPFREIASALASTGIAMLRVDDRGIGGSTGDGDAASGDDVADDGRTLIAWLRARPEVDPDRIALIGHSFGGEVAPLVAAGDPRVAAVVLMGAPAMNFRETMRYQHRFNIGRDASIPDAAKASALEQRMAQQERNVAASTERWRQWSQDRDPLPTLRRVRCPVLILQGTADRAVPVASAHALEGALRQAGNSRVSLKIFENLNHHFNVDPVGATDGYDRLPSQALSRDFKETISSWLSSTLKVARARE